IHPKKVDSAIVGIGLLLFSIYYLIKSNIFLIGVPSWILTYGGWIISGIFILRAIGDFKYVGFLKKIKETKFGKLDTKYYSPLCLITGIIGVIIELIK